MDSEKLTSIYIPHLRDQFKEGSPVLFTGAGFSLGAKYFFGNAIPSYSELVSELWNICYPGDPPRKRH